MCVLWEFVCPNVRKKWRLKEKGDEKKISTEENNKEKSGEYCNGLVVRFFIAALGTGVV